MLLAFIAISSSQASPAETTVDKEKYFLDYAVSHLDGILSYSASGMVLAAHIDASYPTKPKARSRGGGHFFMSKNAYLASNHIYIRTCIEVKSPHWNCIILTLENIPAMHNTNFTTPYGVILITHWLRIIRE